MKFKATISGAFLIIATFSSAQIVHRDSAAFSAFLAKKIINNRDDMLHTAIVASEKGRILVPDEDIWGYVPAQDGFIAIQVQKK